MKHSLLFYFLLSAFLIDNFAYSMDHEQPILDAQPKKIRFFQHQKCPRIFKKLNADENGIILDMLINTLDDEPTKFIHNLLVVCKSLKRFILNHQNTLNLTKQLSWINKTSDENAIQTIQTKTAREILMTQKGFESICEKSFGTLSRQQIIAIKSCKIDINFTYGIYFFATQLAQACQESEQQPCLARWLIQIGADTTVRTYDSSPIALYLLKSHLPMSNKILTYFFASPSFDINHYYSIHEPYDSIRTTILQWFFLCMLETPHSWKEKRKLDEQQKNKLKQLQFLLDNGADPELADSLDMTPLMRAQASKNKIFIDIFKKAIAEKEKTKKIMKKIHEAVAKGTESLEEASVKIYQRSLGTKKKRNNSKRLGSRDVIVFQ